MDVVFLKDQFLDHDFHRCSNKFRFLFFADDTNIFYTDKTLKDLETIVNNVLQNLYNWLTGKKQTLNINISKFVIFHPYQTQLAYQSKLCMFDNEKNKYARLESKVEPKYLGVLLDRNLSRRYYIDSVFTKINKNFGLIEKLRGPAPRPILVLIFRPN